MQGFSKRYVVIEKKGGHGCLTRAIWFLFVGIWAAPIWILFALAFCLTILGLPIGIWMLNRAGAVAFLS